MEGPGGSGRQQVEPETCPCSKESKCFLSCIGKSIVLRLRPVTRCGVLGAVLNSQCKRCGCPGVYVNDHGDGWGIENLTHKESLTEVGVGFGEQKAMGGPYWCVRIPQGQALAGHDFQQRFGSDGLQRCFPTSTTMGLCSSVNTAPKSWYHQNMELVLLLFLTCEKVKSQKWSKQGKAFKKKAWGEEVF